MNGPPDHATREAIAVLRDIRSGNLVLPDAPLGRAIDIAAHAAAANGLDLDAILTSYDPDPRICAPERTTLSEALADLDEQERWAAIKAVHRMEARCADLLREDPAIRPTLWSIAHDRAVADVAAARAASGRKGVM